MKITTKDYKRTTTEGRTSKWDWDVTGLLSANYHVAHGRYEGVKVLVFITNCPNRYYARKAVNWILKRRVQQHGWTQYRFDRMNNKQMPETEIIPFSDVAFAVKPTDYYMPAGESI